MGKEIERKFLVINAGFKHLASGKIEIAQGYLSTDPDRTVRVRLAGDHAFLTIKSRNIGMVRGEWEYEIPCADAHELLRLAVYPPIEKTRWIVPFEGWIWEVDEFHGAHAGLTVAEVELPTVDTLPTLPDFVGCEVTDNPAYYNSNLSKGTGIRQNEQK